MQAAKNAGKTVLSGLGWGLGLLLGAAACGPVQYITKVSQDAASQVAAAKAANAEKYAPYEYTAAVEYLHKAREEEGYADHQAAVHFGRLASENAEKAKKIALENAGKPLEPNPAESGTLDSDTENPIPQVKPEVEAPK